jgi:hypothetical protein
MVAIGGNAMQALTHWRHLVALHGATDALDWAMHILPYPPGGMVIKIVVDLATVFVMVNSIFAHNLR